MDILGWNLSLSITKISLVDQRLAMLYLVISSSNTSLLTLSWLVGIFDGILVGVRRTYSASRVSSCLRVLFFRCFHTGITYFFPTRWITSGGNPLGSASIFLLESDNTLNNTLWVRKDLTGYQVWVSRLVPRKIFLLEVWVTRRYTN